MRLLPTRPSFRGCRGYLRDRRTLIGLTLDDIDLIEINEAIAPVVLAWQLETGADLSKVNVNGGAIAFGHPSA